MKYFFVAMVWAVFLATPASAQDATGGVSGTVIDSMRNAPLSNALVILDSPGAQLTARTDRKGRFSSLSVPAGRVTVRIESAGFSDARIEKCIHAGIFEVIRIRLINGGGSSAMYAYTYYKEFNSRPDAPDPNITSDLYSIGGC